MTVIRDERNDYMKVHYIVHCLTEPETLDKDDFNTICGINKIDMIKARSDCHVESTSSYNCLVAYSAYAFSKQVTEPTVGLLDEEKSTRAICPHCYNHPDLPLLVLGSL